MIAMESAFSPCFSAYVTSYSNPVHSNYGLPTNSQQPTQVTIFDQALFYS